MDKNRLYTALLMAALAMTVIGSVSIAYIVIDPPTVSVERFDLIPVTNDDMEGQDTIKGSDDLGERNDIASNGSFGEQDPAPIEVGSDEHVEYASVYDNGTREDIPVLFPVIVVLTVISAMAFVGITGRAYLESSRQESMVRNDLLDLISVNPGINLTSIRHELQLSQGAVSYHLRRLEKIGSIYSQKGFKERRFYPATMGFTKVEDRMARDELLSMLSNPTTQSIIAMLRKGPATQNDIVRNVGISPSTVHWHMERLERVGAVVKEKDGRSVIYTLLDQVGET